MVVRGLIILGLGIGLSGCGIWNFTEEQANRYRGPDAPYRILEEKVPQMARKYKGFGYRMGADPDKQRASDCSHFVAAVTRNSLNGTGYTFKPKYYDSMAMRDHSNPVKAKEVRPGDLVYFKAQKLTHGRSHVGIVTRNDAATGVVYFAHASPIVGITETSSQSKVWGKYWSKNFDSYRRWKPSVFMDTMQADTNGVQATMKGG